MTNDRAAESTPRLLEAPEWRVEGHLKVTGRAAYAADISRPGMLWAAFRRSDLPHARIRAVDVTAALALPGVHAAITGADIGPVRFGRRLFDQPVLAVDRVRFVGERVGAVAADTRETAEKAAQAITVEYDELPVVLDVDAALEADAPVLHEEAESAEYFYVGGTRPTVPHANIQGRQVLAKGDGNLETAFRTAARVFSHTFVVPRQHQGYIEPHATMVWVSEDGIVHVVSTNKAPFSLRSQMAISLGLPPESIDVDSGFIGGDFGGKGYTPDEFACYFLARATGRPVRTTMTYAEELAAANPRHAARIHLRTGVDAAGRFVAHEARLLFNGGAYAAAKPLPHLGLPGGTQTMAAYRIPNVAIEALTVYTNTAPGGHMRSPGEVQALFAGESHVDAMARELGHDPLHFRLLNALRPGDIGPGGEQHTEARAVEILETLGREAAWGTPLPPNRGRGVALGVHRIGTGKTAMRLSFEADGSVTVLTGVPDQGGGSHTAIQRIVAAVLSVSAESVRVRRASTAGALEDAGVGASRATHIGSRAAQRGANELKEQLEAAATRTLGESEERIRLVDGWLVDEAGVNRISLAAAASTLLAYGPIEADGEYEARPHRLDEPEDHNFCGYVVEVDVDPETGALSVVQATLVADVGTIVNPVAHQGQLDGGFVFGLGAALMEELVLADGRVVTLNLGDYKLPTSMDVPPLRTVLLPTALGPGAFGAKMAGELTNAGVAPAVANALADAVGVRLFSLPLSAERIYAALKLADAGAELRS
jgi:carbon-monoxide dehydrogenase large subunit